MVDPATFERYVQEALDHLYDPAYLLVHPLGALLIADGPEQPGQALHRALREALNLLKPPAEAPHHSPAWRSYRYLWLRYVEMLTIGQVADELAISTRQCRRDHHDAIRAIGSILWDQHQRRLTSGAEAKGTGVAPEAHGEERLLETEVRRIGSSSSDGARMDQVVESAVATLAALARQKSIHLAIAPPVGAPPVRADRTALRQILVELLLFAIDQGPNGRVELSVVPAEGAVRLSIAVRAPEGSDEIEPELRNEARLAVSRQLAAQQGLILRLERAEDGPRITLEVPVAEIPTVLVVDDNADVVHLFRRYLDGQYQIHAATDGEQAIALAHQLSPAVITLDVMMPARDGWEVLQVLKQDPATAEIPIMVCSVLRERELALSLGATEFLAKPIMAPELLEALRRCLAAR